MAFRSSITKALRPVGSTEKQIEGIEDWSEILARKLKLGRASGEAFQSPAFN
jgi:hypothetical protein